MTTRYAERDPLPERPWEPTSRDYRRREALQATAEAVRKAKDSRKRPIAGQPAEEMTP